jgi:hypothetical protein
LATARNNSHIVSVFTTVVLVMVINSRVTAFHAPSTLKRCRPDAARTKTRAIDHRQPSAAEPQPQMKVKGIVSGS